VLQLYEFLRTSTCSVSIQDLRPATSAEVERMHGDCAICWCEMTVLGSQVNSPSTDSALAADGDGSSSSSGSSSSTIAAGGALQPGSRSSADSARVAAAVPQGAAPAAALNSEAAQAVTAAAAVAEAPGAHCQAADTLPADGSVGFSLPCRHAYHQACLNQVGSRAVNSCNCWQLHGMTEALLC
jgi:hypothetical protein